MVQELEVHVHCEPGWWGGEELVLETLKVVGHEGAGEVGY
jgi:hypothetical protein